MLGDTNSVVYERFQLYDKCCRWQFFPLFKFPSIIIMFSPSPIFASLAEGMAIATYLELYNQKIKNLNLQFRQAIIVIAKYNTHPEEHSWVQ